MKKRSLRLLFAVVLAVALVMSVSAPAMALAYNFSTPLPSSKTVAPNEHFTLSVAFNSGGQPATYNWYYSYSPDGSNRSLQYSETSASGSSVEGWAQSNTYVWCEVTFNGYTYPSGMCSIYVQSTPGFGATVTPTPTPNASTTVGIPVITVQPAAVTVTTGQTATLTVVAQSTGGSLQYQWYCSNAENGSNAVAITGANSPSYTVSPSAADKYYYATVWATNGYSNSTPVYSAVVKVSYNDGQLKITKQPTGETVEVGGSAMFIARADNATSITWRLVSRDTTQTVNAAQAASYFNGLSITGANSETLTLINIPATLDGWSAECKFTGPSGTIYSHGAIIEVKGAQPTPTPTPHVTATVLPSSTPAANSSGNGQSSAAVTITTQPVGAVLAEGETTTLSVAATAPAGTTLKYQWYRNDKNSNANGTAVAGAQDASYVPDTISGSKYYYVGVWSTDGTTTSKVIYSSPVAVTYTAPIATPAPTSTPQPTPAVSDSSGFGSKALVPVIIMVVAAIVIGVGAFFLLRNVSGDKRRDRDDDRYYDDFDDFDDYNDRGSRRDRRDR